MDAYILKLKQSKFNKLNEDLRFHPCSNLSRYTKLSVSIKNTSKNRKK